MEALVFIYSRRSQLALFLAWLAGLAFMYARLDGEAPLRPAPVGQTSELAAPEPPPPPPPAEPAPDPRPAADPALNRCLDLRLIEAAGEADALVLELDYVAAQTNGFTLEKARGYSYADAPVFVIALGEPWVSDMENASFSVRSPQATEVTMVVSKSRNLRLLIHTKSRRAAREARLSLSPTDKGLRAEIRLPR